jgi:glycosyltransferase involved in cell wall biosynthesis
MSAVAGARVLCLVFGPNPSTQVRAVGRQARAATDGIDWSWIQMEPTVSLGNHFRPLGRIGIKAQRLLGKILMPLLLWRNAKRIQAAEIVYVIKTPPLWVSRWVARRCPVRVYDFDDPLWIPEMKGQEWFLQTMANFPSYTCDNQFAIDFVEASSVTSSGIILPGEMPELSSNCRNLLESEFNVAWIGSYTTFRYLASIAQPLKTFFATHEHARLLLLGAAPSQISTLDISPDKITSQLKYGPEEMEEYLSRTHVGLFPLTDEPLAYLRGTHKINVYNAFGVPTISSPVLGIEQVIVSGASGFICLGDNQWLDALSALSKDRQLLSSMRELATLHHRELQESLNRAPADFVRFARGLGPSEARTTGARR